MAAPVEVLISSDSSGQMWNACVWDIHSGTSLISYKGGSTSPHGLCLLGNQYLLGAANSKPLIHVWALQRRDQQQMKIVCPGPVTSLAVSGDGAYCVAGVAEKIHIWQVCSGNLMAVLSRHYQEVNVIKFTDDSSHFISGGEDNLVLVWSLSSVLSIMGDQTRKPEPEKVWSSHSLPVTDLHVGRGGSRARVISSSLDQTCKVWDLVSGELLVTLVFDASILSVAMDMAEYRIFAGGSNGNIYSVNMYGQPVRAERHIESDSPDVSCYKGHSRQVSCLAVSLDGTKLVSGSHDCSVRVWDVFSSQCVNTINHKGSVTNVLLVPTPPSVVNPKLKPTLPLRQFKRHLYTPGGDDSDNVETLEMRLHGQEDEADTTDEMLEKLKSDSTQEVDTQREQELSRLKEDLKQAKSVNKDLYHFAIDEILHDSNKVP